MNGVIDTRYGALMPRLAVNLVGPHYFDGDNQLRQGTYATLDSSLGWQATERMNISVYVDNLFDRRYRTYGYMNGSSAVAQVNMVAPSVSIRELISLIIVKDTERYPFYTTS